MGRYQIPIAAGEKFGKYTVIEESGRRNGQVVWLCECQCGSQREIRSWTLRHTPDLMCKDCRYPKKPKKEVKTYKDVPGVSKECRKCKEVKPISEFSKCSSNKDNLQSYCIDCKKVLWKASYTPKPKPKCKECGKEEKLKKGYCLEHYRLFFVPKYNHTKVCMKCFKPAKPIIKGYCHVHYRMYIYDKTPQGRKAKRRRWQRRMQDPKYKMLKNVRRRASQMIKKISQDNYKKTHFLKYLGCTSDFLKKWIESRFTEGMSWENYGQGKGTWCIDHIKPISKMDTDCEQSIREYCHYTNLQPLWFEENVAKSDSTDWN